MTNMFFLFFLISQLLLQNLFPIFFTGANLPRIFLNYVLQEKHPIIKGFGANSSLGI
jgi:hypothetical protein